MAELFPDDVRRFLDENVETIDQLELLRLLWEEPGAERTDAALADELQLTRAAAAGHVAALAGRGLLHAEHRAGGWACRYGPRDPQTDARLRQVLELYRERPVSMIKLVAARAKDPLRKFADAFRLRPPAEGG